MYSAWPKANRSGGSDGRPSPVAATAGIARRRIGGNQPDVAQADECQQEADARSGRNLWHMQTGSPIAAAPITFMLNNKQYVVIGSGGVVMAFALP